MKNKVIINVATISKTNYNFCRYFKNTSTGDKVRIESKTSVVNCIYFPIESINFDFYFRNQYWHKNSEEYALIYHGAVIYEPGYGDYFYYGYKLDNNLSKNEQKKKIKMKLFL